MKFRKIFIWLLLLTYVLTTLLLHKRGNDFAGSFVIAYGPASYREGVWILSIIVASVITPFLIRKLWIDRVRVRYLLALLPVAAIIDRTMISVPLERIHYVQYGILTWLCYLALGEAFPAALMAFLIGYIDEAHQFWVLYAADPIQYFDWNDISLNLLGVLGTLFLFLPLQPLWRPDIKRLCKTLAAWSLLVAALLLFYRPDRYLFRNDPYKGSQSFWIASTDRSYHVMNAAQGMLFLGCIWIIVGSFYSAPGLARRSSEVSSEDSEPDFSHISSDV